MVHLVGRFKAVQSALAMCVTFRRLKLNTLSPLNWLFRATMLQVRGALRRSYRTLSCNSSSLSHAFHYGMMCALALWCLRTLFVRNRDAVPYFLFHLWLLWRDAACSAQTSAGPAWLPSKSKHVGPALHPYYCRHEPGLQSVTIGRLTAIHHVQGVSIPSKLYFACRTAHRPLGCVLFSIALWSRLFTFHYVPLRGVFFFSWNFLEGSTWAEQLSYLARLDLPSVKNLLLLPHLMNIDQRWIKVHMLQDVTVGGRLHKWLLKKHFSCVIDIPMECLVFTVMYLLTRVS